MSGSDDAERRAVRGERWLTSQIGSAYSGHNLDRPCGLQLEFARLQRRKQDAEEANRQLQSRLFQQRVVLRAQKDRLAELERSTNKVKALLQTRVADVQRLHWRLSTLRDAARIAENRRAAAHVDLMHSRARLPSAMHTPMNGWHASGNSFATPAPLPGDTSSQEVGVYGDKEQGTDRAIVLAELQIALEAIAGPSRNSCGWRLCRGVWCTRSLCLSWCILCCIALDTVPGAQVQWPLFVALLLLIVATSVVRACTCRALKLHEESPDDYDLDRLLPDTSRGSDVSCQGRGGCLGNDAEHLVYHKDMVLAPCADLLRARRPILLLGAVCGLMHVLFLVLLTARRPLACKWSGMEVHSELSEEFEPLLGGEIRCGVRDTTLSLAAIYRTLSSWFGDYLKDGSQLGDDVSQGEQGGSGQSVVLAVDAATWLVCAFPVLWAVTWWGHISVFTREGAELLLDFTVRREGLLLACGACGSTFFDLVVGQLWSHAHELLQRRRLAWWLGWQLLMDGLDCADMWRALVTEPRLVAVRAHSSPTLDKSFGASVAMVRSDVTAPARFLWWMAFGIVAVGSASVSLGPYLQAAYGSLSEAHITEANRHRIFVQFMKRELKLPNRNHEAVVRALSSLLLIDMPFLVVRVALTWHLRVPASLLVAKNVSCAAYHVLTMVSFLQWQRRVRDMLFGGNFAQAYEHDIRMLDKMTEQQTDFLELFFLDLIGIPVGAAASECGFLSIHDAVSERRLAAP